MANSTLQDNTAFASNQWGEDSQIWQNLKTAIASSSGFQRWELERNLNLIEPTTNLDQLVSLYLRETLETLAY
ncbi:hypothetical protein PCC9214_03202 [Planktothrix tepida]|uniref:Uncharacterized protein n=3 Tax=Planktothrix TaxID=54304 RepID=A0A1J1LRW7_9CYAN|nr:MULTISPECIES: hypothetical protein [Planktothrix]MBD2484183.1 hypothetical protein [Planktothrix sp. FACHB-1365]MBE9145979.1 hypothetical protein [Planktothrix mougeotii LEGE 06226]CAD5949194.1 hypothetical protein NO713_02443 [Planktothrix pseudagardhii]CAD5961248.1 hypothetical protein PCC9214_03202 [Planktothrix tepida]CUR34754.1 conserved hypothetical protein [Planktothrix tepida PCC 9214]